MKTEEKTVKQWLDTLKEPYKTEAFNNTLKGTLNRTAYSLHSALMMSFVFHSSREGNDYWWEVLKTLSLDTSKV